MSTYKVDLGTNEVVEMDEKDEALYLGFAETSGLADWLAGKGLDVSEGRAVTEDAPGGADRIGRIKDELRKIAVRLVELETEADPPSEEIARLRRRYRDLMGRLRERPGGGAPERDRYPGDDLSEREPGQPFGVHDLLRIAAEDDRELPDDLREQAELEEALRRQAHEDAFGGEDPSDGMSDEFWNALSPDMRGEEGGFGDG